MTHWDCIEFIQEGRGNCILDPYVDKWFGCFLKGDEIICNDLLNNFCDNEVMATCIAEWSGNSKSCFENNLNIFCF